jgi:hypothetical protein
MKMKIILLLIGLILFLHGCATSTSQKVNLAAVASRDQKIGDQQTVTSQKKHFVSLGPYSELKLAKDKTIFMLIVQNCGKEPINTGNDNISVVFQENAKKGAFKKINIQPFDDFMNDLKEEYGDNEKKYIKSALENIKLDSESSSSAVSDSDSLGDKVKDLKTRIETMRAQNQIIREMLPEFSIKSQVIMPGKSLNEIVVCDPRDLNKDAGGNFQVAVLVDGEVHKFVFKRSLNIKK